MAHQRDDVASKFAMKVMSQYSIQAMSTPTPVFPPLLYY